MAYQQQKGWAVEEFSNVDLGDERLNHRLIKLSDSLSESPESPINQACSNWADTKAAYRFFKNENAHAANILKSHIEKTAQRARKYKTILALQDTTYLIYTHHPKTTGLGKISMKRRKNGKEMLSHGLIMHTSLAVSTKGLPLGILDQHITARISKSSEVKKLRDRTPIEDKESYRWLESLKNTKEHLKDPQVVTVCDREADMYEFFQMSQGIHSPVLVRAKVNRTIHQRSRYGEKNTMKLWPLMKKQPVAGIFNVEVPSKEGNPSRIATLEVRYGSFELSPPRNKIKHKISTLPNLPMHAIYVLEKKPPLDQEALEWMLLTNLPVSNYDEAFEKVRWYCLRWRIEMFHKVLKSGFTVESCRLGNADRLIRYLTVMSIIGWRIFMITLLSRTDPDLPCSLFLSETEWKPLYLKITKNKICPKKIPQIRNAVRWIAQLGGFLARKGDGEPGTITLWRGWKRLADLTEGWNLALQC